MNDLSFLVASHVPRANHTVSKHLIGYATIQYMARGSLYLRYDQTEYALEGSGWFWTAYPGPFTVFHRAVDCDTWDHRHLAFQGPLISQWMANGLWPSEPQRAPDGRDWGAYFDQMAQLALTPTRWGRLRGLNMLEGLLLHLAEQRHASERRDPWLESVLSDLSLDVSDYRVLADKHGMALSTLRRRFQKATGVPIHQHALLARLAKARTMLVETDLPVKAISDSLGYQNVYYFSRQFKRFIGVPPARFRATR